MTNLKILETAIESLDAAARKVNAARAKLMECVGPERRRGTTYQTLVLEVPDGAKPVESNFDTEIVNQTGEDLVVQVGAAYPLPMPGRVMITIPDEESGGVQNEGNVTLTTVLAVHEMYDPCFPPPPPGTLCLDPPVFSRDPESTADATPPGEWPSRIRVTKDDDGFNLVPDS